MVASNGTILAPIGAFEVDGVDALGLLTCPDEASSPDAIEVVFAPDAGAARFGERTAAF
jgi:hypothetical protein